MSLEYIIGVSIAGDSTRIPTLNHPTILRCPSLHFDIESLFTVPHSPQATEAWKRHLSHIEHIFRRLIQRLVDVEADYIFEEDFEDAYFGLRQDFAIGPVSLMEVEQLEERLNFLRRFHPGRRPWAGVVRRPVLWELGLSPEAADLSRLVGERVVGVEDLVELLNHPCSGLDVVRRVTIEQVGNLEFSLHSLWDLLEQVCIFLSRFDLVKSSDQSIFRPSSTHLLLHSTSSGSTVSITGETLSHHTRPSMSTS